MDTDEPYAYEIQHEIAFLKTRKANYAILSQLSIIYMKSRTTMNECMSHGKTTIEYEDE